MDRESIFLVAWRLNRFFPLLVGSLVLLNIIAYLSLNYFALPRRDGLEKQLMALQAKVRQQRQSGADENAPAEIYRRGEADLQKFLEAIPTKGQFPALLGELFSLASQAGLVIDQISYQPKDIPEEDLLLYGLAFSVQGNYGQVKRFISSLEQSERLIVIDDLGLSGDQDAGEAKVKMRLKLATLFRVEAS